MLYYYYYTSYVLRAVQAVLILGTKKFNKLLWAYHVPARATLLSHLARLACPACLGLACKIKKTLRNTRSFLMMHCFCTVDTNVAQY